MGIIKIRLQIEGLFVADGFGDIDIDAKERFTEQLGNELMKRHYRVMQRELAWKKTA